MYTKEALKHAMTIAQNFKESHDRAEAAIEAVRKAENNSFGFLKADDRKVLDQALHILAKLSKMTDSYAAQEYALQEVVKTEN